MVNFNSNNPLGYMGINQAQQPIFVRQNRAPLSGDFYPPGTVWQYYNTSTQVSLFYVSCGSSAPGSNVWAAYGSSSGDILAVNGTANQITSTTSSGVATISLPSAITTPGSLSTTTTLTGGTGITATTGNITATNGNIVRGTAGNKDVYSSVASTTSAGANSAGTVTLVGGTATVNTTAVTASSIIRIYRQGIGSTGAAALGFLTIGTITASTSFVINSVQAADATALQASDVSVVAWEIVN